MASCTRNARFELRRNTSSNWTTVDPKLLAGEPGVELDTGQMKVGDGIRTWSLLPYVGTAGGAGATGPLIFTASQQAGKDLRTLTGYYENSITKTVRDSYFSGAAGAQRLVLVLASFNPTVTATGTPNSVIFWDYAATGFTVTVTNPTDFPTEYISSVSSISTQSGNVSALSDFTRGTQTPVAGGGINWTQQFSTNANAVIRPLSTDINGGSASAKVYFNYINGSSPQTVYTTTSTWTITWMSPSSRIGFNQPAAKTFLDFYSSITYFISQAGMFDTNNISHSIVPTRGTIDTGTSVFTFTDAIIKDNMATSRDLTLTTTFARPANVTGTSYNVIYGPSIGTVNVNFTYPSFLMFTPTFANVPQRSDIVSGNSFSGNVTLLGDKQNTFGPLAITSPSAEPISLWFAIASTVSPQPKTFKAGPETANLARIDYYSTASPPVPPTVSLQPDTPLPGYTPVTYNLYGITLNPGVTYVQILL